MPRRCATCGEPGRNVAVFCGRCGARADAQPDRDPAAARRRPRRTLADRGARFRRGDLVGAALALGFVALLATGLEVDEAVGEVDVPSTAPARDGVAAARRPGSSATPAPAPALAPCGPADAPLCRRWARVRARGHDELLAASSTTVYVGDDEGSVTAYDRRDGERLWTVPAGVGGLREGEITTGRIVVAGAGGSIGNDRVAAIGTAGGTVAWSTSAADPVELRVVGGNILLLEPGRIRGLDPASGDERWAWDPSDPHAEIRIVAAPPEGPVVTSGGAVTGLDATTGLARWGVALPHLRGAAPGGAGRVVAVDSSGRLVGIDADSGAIVWESQLAFGERSAVRMTGADGIVLVAVDPPIARDGSRTPRIVGVDPDSGAVRWVHLYLTRVERRGIELSPEAGVLVGTTTPGTVAAIDLSSGHVSWQRDLGNEPAHVRIDHGTIVAASGRTVSVLELADGSIRAQARTASPVIGIVALDGTTAVLKTTTDVQVVELPAATSG